MSKAFPRITIGHDGKVHQCINGADGKNILGNVQHKLLKVWDGEKNKKLRQSFKNHIFKNTSCNFCSYAFAQEKVLLQK